MWTADSLKSPWCWERLRAEGEEGIRGWDGWMASPMQWTWTWQTWGDGVGQTGMLQFMGSQRVGHDQVTDWQQQSLLIGLPWCQRWRSSIQAAKTRPGADCGSDHELLIAKFRLKLKKVGETTRPFRYDLNQIPYDYTVEKRNRFKGLDLIDRVPDELWNEVCDIVQETGIKTIPMEKKCKKAKWLSGEALQIGVKRREVKSKGEKERYKYMNAEFQRIARRDKKAFFSDQCKEIEENNRMGKTRDLVKKIRDTKGTFHAKMGSIKDRNGMDLTEAEDIKKRWQEYTEELQKRSSRPR